VAAGKNTDIFNYINMLERQFKIRWNMAAAQNEPPLPGIMPGRLPESATPQEDFNPVAVAKGLLRATRAGALATIDRNTGHPFSSLVNVATDVDGSPLILISRLASHTANLETDPRASILLASTGKGDPLAHPRLTVLGALARIARDTPDAVRAQRRFLSRHPKSRLYAGFGDFSFWRLQAVSAHLNGGFARAADLKAGDLLTRIDDAAEIVEIEEGAIAHMNGDHRDAVGLFASRLLGEADGAWEVTGIDPDGIDLAHGDAVTRLPFAGRVTNGHALRSTLAKLAAKARTPA
jgi:putative heme iron utilization protein